MPANKKNNTSKYVPIWIPEYVFTSLIREADQRNEDVSQLFLTAWTSFLSSGMKDYLKEDMKKAKISPEQKGEKK